MGWGVAFLDYNNDTRPDLFMVNGHVYPEIEVKLPDQMYRQRTILYRNIDGKRLEDVTEKAGPDLLTRRASRGLATGDFDNDGNVDIFINNMNATPSLLHNRGSGQRFISIKLVGVKSNRTGIGARVTLTAGGRQQVQEVRSGSTFLSQSDLRMHFGLGLTDTVDRIDVEWPYADSKDSVTNVKAGQFVTMVEGRGIVK
jgi:hypothetical protein